MNAHRRFDELVANTLCNTAGVAGDLPPHAQTIAQLPIAEGGLGLPRFAAIAPFAYGSSAGDIETDQRTGTIIYNTALLNTLPPATRTHISKYKSKFASLWLRKFGALDEAAAQVTSGFAGSLRLRLGLQIEMPNERAERAVVSSCPGCAIVLDGVPAARAHSIRCASWSGGHTVTHRHHGVRDAIAQLFQETGATVSREQAISSERIMDLVVSSANGSHIWLDVGVSDVDTEAMEAEKISRYRALSIQHDATFHPLVFDTAGNPTTRTRAAVQRLSCELELTTANIMSTIVAAIVKGNGLIVAKAEAHMRTATARTRIRAEQQQQRDQPQEQPPPRERDQDDDADVNWMLRRNQGTRRDDEEIAAAADMLAAANLPQTPARSRTAFSPNRRDEAAMLQQVLVTSLHDSGGVTRRLTEEAIQATFRPQAPEGSACVVCLLDILEGPVSMARCGHVLHFDCGAELYRTRDTCPLCRRPA